MVVCGSGHDAPVRTVHTALFCSSSVLGSVWQCAWQFAAVYMAVCGSVAVCGNVRLHGSAFVAVEQCAAVYGSARGLCAAVRTAVYGSVWQCVAVRAAVCSSALYVPYYT